MLVWEVPQDAENGLLVVQNCWCISAALPDAVSKILGPSSCPHGGQGCPSAEDIGLETVLAGLESYSPVGLYDIEKQLEGVEGTDPCGRSCSTE